MSHTDPRGARAGTIDGVCVTCGAPRRRMGWLNWPNVFWLMCTASQKKGCETKYGRCDLPTEAAARQRLGLVP